MSLLWYLLQYLKKTNCFVFLSQLYYKMIILPYMSYNYYSAKNELPDLQIIICFEKVNNIKVDKIYCMFL